MIEGARLSPGGEGATPAPTLQSALLSARSASLATAAEKRELPAERVRTPSGLQGLQTQ